MPLRPKDTKKTQKIQNIFGSKVACLGDFVANGFSLFPFKTLKLQIKLLFFLIMFSFSAFPQDAKFDSVAATGIKQIYNVQFEDAEKTFRSLISDYPQHPAGRFFLAMIDWWKILLDIDNESLDDLFYQKLEDVIFQCDGILKKDEGNIDALFFKGGAIGFRGRLRAVRESWLKAADDGREALPIVERAAKLNPKNQDVQLGFGIYNYYAAVIPDQYPLVKPLMIFFPSGDKAKGIEQLKNTAFNGKYAKYEARYFLMTLNFQYENNPYEADTYATMLTTQFPNNPNFERWMGRIAVRKGEGERYHKIFSTVLEKCKQKKRGYNQTVEREANYYVGLFFKSINNPDSSIIYFEKSLQLSSELDKEETSGFQINTVLYLGMMYDALNQRDKAKEYYNRVLDMREYGSSRSMAKQYLEKPFKN
ncbi:MAG: tetratricopeptide repeat protein [Ignavibacteria bacterium]|nr:tetratricopeptide repeat protein [Ignavibacteria bacterium]